MIYILMLIANLSVPTNITSIGGFAGWTNSTVNDILGTGILLAMFVIILVGGAIRGSDIIGSMTAAAWLCTLISLLMLLNNPPLVSSLTPAIFGGVAIMGIILMLTKGGSGVF